MAQTDIGKLITEYCNNMDRQEELNESLFKKLPKKEWIGKNLIDLGLRKVWNLNVVAVRQRGELWHFVDPKEPFSEDSLLLIVMEKKHMKKWQ